MSSIARYPIVELVILVQRTTKEVLRGALRKIELRERRGKWSTSRVLPLRAPQSLRAPTRLTTGSPTASASRSPVGCGSLACPEHLFHIAFAVVLTFCSKTSSPRSSSTQYQLDRSPKSKPMVSSSIFLNAFVVVVLIFFMPVSLFSCASSAWITWELIASRSGDRLFSSQPGFDNLAFVDSESGEIQSAAP